MYEYEARVRSVYDGDSLRADIDLGFGVILKNQSIRLLGIDAPEMREERGIVVRDVLRERIAGKTVKIQTVKDSKGKYGRWLGVVFADGDNVNQWLVDQGLAEPYF